MHKSMISKDEKIKDLEAKCQELKSINDQLRNEKQDLFDENQLLEKVVQDQQRQIDLLN